MGKCYLVTGAGGRLGSSFVEILCANNSDGVATLKLVDLTFKEEIKNRLSAVCKDSGIEVQWITGSILDEALMRSAAAGVDVALHMAGIIDFSNTVPDDVLWNVNYEGTITALEACFSANVPYFIYTSSSGAVGPNANGDPMHSGDEDTEYPYLPMSWYYRSKHEAEGYVIEANGRALGKQKEFIFNLYVFNAYYQNIIKRFYPKRLSSTNSFQEPFFDYDIALRFVTCALRPPFFYGGNDPALQIILRRSGKDKMLKNPASSSALHNSMRLENIAWSHIVAAKQIQVEPSKIGGYPYFLGDDTPAMSLTRLNYFFLKPYGFQLSKREPFLPYWVFYVIAILLINFAKLLGLFGIKKEVLMTPEVLTVVSTCFTASHQKFTRDFGYKPLLTWEESLEKTREEAKRTMDALEK